MPNQRRYDEVLARCERWELAPGDKGYPAGLLDLDPHAPVLRGVGDPSVMLDDCISIIGARECTPYGRSCARLAGRVAAECGIVVVSGGAVGCDQAAGLSALDHGGKTVVVPGCGADVVYPLRSQDLFCRAATGGGCVVSMEGWGMQPTRYTFVNRNRVIAAMSASTLVCEAGKPSGTFATATCAAELGRHVYAVPGSIFSQSYRGTNWLIESGASIVTDAEAIEALVSLDYGRLRMAGGQEQGSRGKLLDALVASPMFADEVSEFLKLDIPSTLALLAEQEALGAIERLQDGSYGPSQSLLIGAT